MAVTIFKIPGDERVVFSTSDALTVEVISHVQGDFGVGLEEARALADGKPSTYGPGGVMNVEVVVTRLFTGPNTMEVRFTGPGAAQAALQYAMGQPIS